MAVCYSVSRTANSRNLNFWGLDRSRGSYIALMMEVQLGILRGEIDVTQKLAQGLAALRRLLVRVFLRGVG